MKLLESHGRIVGMTSDVVNDAARAAADVVLLVSGLPVVFGAIRRAREIFARMVGYAIHHIAETIRVLLLITLDFFPVTPLMIVVLAVLNDAAILSIAYDRVLTIFLASSQGPFWSRPAPAPVLLTP